MAVTKTPFTPYAVQKALGVPEDGKWGEATEKAARAFLGPVAASWDKSRLVIGVQQKMMTQANIQVEVDGFNGPDTKAAFEKFEAMARSPQQPRPEVGWWSTMFQLGAAMVQAHPLTQQPFVIPAADPPKVVTSPVKVEFPKQSDVEAFYGPVGSNQVLIAAPWPMVLAWDKSTAATKISLHQKVAPSAQRCFEAVKAAYGPDGIEKLGLNLWGGSLNVRKMRGGSNWSMHSWGIAMDFDPDRNELRMDHTKARLAKPDAKLWFEIWEAAGWTSLGRTRDFDWMHIQAASL